MTRIRITTTQFFGGLLVLGAFLMFGALLAFTSGDAPKPFVTTIENGALITLGGSTQVEYQFTSLANGPERIATILIISSSSGVKVGAGGITLGSGNYSFPSDSRILMTFKNGVYNLQLKGSNGDTIAVSY